MGIKKTVDLEAKEHLVERLKPCKVEVIVQERIDGACKGKNNWDDTLRLIGPCVLDVFVVHVRDQTLQTWQTFMAKWMSSMNIYT